MQSKIHQQMQPADMALLILLSILWGGSFFFVEILLRHMPALTLVAARVSMAAIALWLIIGTLKLPIPKDKAQWRALFIIGLLNNALPFSLIVWGQTQISSGLAAIFNATTPFFTVIIAGIVLTDERLTRHKLAGVLIGVLGVIILIGPEALNGLSHSVIGQLAVIGAAISYACAAAYARRFKAWGLSPLIVATGQVTMASVILLPLALGIDRPWTLNLTGNFFSLEVFGTLLALALLSTVLAYIIYFRLIASAGASNAALVTFLVPISAIILGVTFLGERFTTGQGAGMALIGAGLLVMDGRVLKRFAPQ